MQKGIRGLSERQQRILSFIRSFVEERGYPPAIRDMVKGCGLSSTSVADYNLKVLEKQGYIHRAHEVSRGIELVGRRRAVVVPLVGVIAAGQPIPVPQPDAWANPALEFLELPNELIRGREGVYALRVKGTSMVDALVGDGDIVLMQAASTAEDGEMVAVWLKEEKEVTLKKLYREKGHIRLQPANSQMQPSYILPDKLEVQGRVIAVIRSVS